MVGAGLWATRRRERARAGASAIAWVAALASTLAVAVVDPGTFVEPTTPTLPFVVLCVSAVAVVATYAVDAFGFAAPARLRSSRWLDARPWVLLLLAFGLGVWMLRASPAPAIDVWTVHQQGADAILHGRQVYAPGAIETLDTHSRARAIDAYAYPPLNLLLTAAAYAVTKETRWAQLVAIVLGAALLRATAQRRGLRHPLPDLLMACLLFHPRGLFVLEQAWGEPLALPLLGGFALAASAGRPRLAAVTLGLLCALKQHYLLYLPALALLPGIGLAGVAIALATLLATYAPFALSAPAGLWSAVIVHHLKNPFRADSLSLTAMASDADSFFRRGSALPARSARCRPSSGRRGGSARCCSPALWSSSSFTCSAARRSATTTTCSGRPGCWRPRRSATPETEAGTRRRSRPPRRRARGRTPAASS